MLVAISTIVLLLIGLGLAQRHQPRVHMPLMILAFVMDLGLVLYIEWSRHAVETLAEGLKTPFSHQFLLFHVSVSALTLLLYVALIASGASLFRGRALSRPVHRGLAFAFIACRLTNYVTSFWMA